MNPYTYFAIYSITIMVFVSIWERLLSRVKNLESKAQEQEFNRAEDAANTQGLRRIVQKQGARIRTLENVLRNVRATQIKQRQRTPMARPTFRNRELMKLGRDIQSGAVDKEVRRIVNDD